MRILFTFAGGSGHFEPLVPLARAAAEAGHTVAFAGQTAMLQPVEAAGFTAFATGGATLSAPGRRLPLLELDRRREERDLREGFALRLARERMAAIAPLCASWQPTLLVCDEVDFGAMLAAEQSGMPYASVVVIAAGSFVRPDVVGPALNTLRSEHGLSDDPDLTMLSRYLVLAPVPPSYRDPAFPLPPTAHLIRPIFAGGERGSALSPWPSYLPDAPRVYFTLGTIFNSESGDLVERVLEGLGKLSLNVVATVGRALDPASFGPQPPNIHLAQYIPQGLILPHCDAVVSHAGSGSVLATLGHGLPMVLLPMGADQPHNAERCADLGVAQVLDAIAATPDVVRAAVLAVLTGPSYRLAARRLQDEIAALPEAASAVPLLERLASERQPITRS